MKGNIDLSIVICSLNEIGHISTSYEELLSAGTRRTEGYEVIFVDNGSSDGTREYLGSIHHNNVKVIFNEANLGKGGSIKRAIKESHGDYIVIHDPDGEYSGFDLWKLYDEAIINKADLVLGSRNLGGGAAYAYLANYWGVLALTALINTLYGSSISDAATAMKLMRGSLARAVKWECNGFDLDFEIVVRFLRLGAVVYERRVEYRPRSKADGKKLNAWRDGARSLVPIFRDRFKSLTSIVPGQ